MIHVTPVQFSHIKSLQQLEGMFFTGVNDDAHVRMILDNSTGFTMLAGTTVLGCGGMILQWPGVGLLWMMVSKDLKRRPRLLLTVANDILDRIRIKGRIHRFQVYVDPAEPRHIRFIEALGFTFEGRMIQHTVDRKDHLLYARTY